MELRSESSEMEVEYLKVTAVHAASVMRFFLCSLIFRIGDFHCFVAQFQVISHVPSCDWTYFEVTTSLDEVSSDWICEGTFPAVCSVLISSVSSTTFGFELS